MNMQKISGARIDDFYYKVKHDSGLQILIYPKPKTVTSYAIFGTRYGSIDNLFKKSGDETAEKVPEGIAHYLEHKLFESEDGDAFARYAKTGASANAFTSFETTCYLFSCTDLFYESLEILLDFVQSPYFTEQTVKKEQGIIAQEIKMYDDDPQWCVMFNYLKAMYHKHPVRNNIAGSVESIAKITPEILYHCYNSFYNLHNMTLSVVGPVDPEKVLQVCDCMLKKAEPFQIERLFEDEPSGIVVPYTEQRLSVAAPLFQFGYKEVLADEDRTERDFAAMEVLLDMLASDASPLFRRLLDQGLINEASFSHEYFEGAGFGSILFGGESSNPEAVAKEIKAEIARMKQDGLDEAAFIRSKKSIYGAAISSLNNVQSIAHGLIDASFKGMEFFSQLECYTELTLAEVQQKLDTVFAEEQSVLSVILPL